MRVMRVCGTFFILWRGDNMANLPYDKSVFYKELVEIKEALRDIAELLRVGLLSKKETDAPEKEV